MTASACNRMDVNFLLSTVSDNISQIPHSSAPKKSTFNEMLETAKILKNTPDPKNDNWKTALELYEIEIPKLQENTTIAKYYAAKMYMIGTPGIKQDLIKAEKYFLEFIKDHSAPHLFVAKAKYYLAFILYENNNKNDYNHIYKLTRDIYSLRNTNPKYKEIKDAAYLLFQSLNARADKSSCNNLFKRIPCEKRFSLGSLSKYTKIKFKNALSLSKDKMNDTQALKLVNEILNDPFKCEIVEEKNIAEAKYVKAYILLNTINYSWDDWLTANRLLDEILKTQLISKETHALALFENGEIYRLGKSKQIDLELAKKDYTTIINDFKDCQEAYEKALLCLAIIKSQNREEIQIAYDEFNTIHTHSNYSEKTKLMALYHIASILITGGPGVDKNEEEAEKILRRLIEMDVYPIKVYALFTLAKLLMERNDLDGSYDLFHKIITNSYSNKLSLAYSRYNMANIIFKKLCKNFSSVTLEKYKLALGFLNENTSFNETYYTPYVKDFFAAFKSLEAESYFLKGQFFNATSEYRILTWPLKEVESLKLQANECIVKANNCGDENMRYKCREYFKKNTHFSEPSKKRKR